jgi:hypothetical protein
MVTMQAERDRRRVWEHTWPRTVDEHDATTGLETFINCRSLNTQHRESLRTFAAGSAVHYTMQEQVIAADDAARAAMTIIPRPGETVSVLDLIEVSRKWQEYTRKVIGAAARTAKEDVTLRLTEKELMNLDQFSHFLQSFVTLQEYLAAPVRYGANQLKLCLNIYRGIQYSLGNEITADQKKTMSIMGWSAFDNASLQMVEGGAAADMRGSAAACMGSGGVAWGAGGTTPQTAKREKGTRVKAASLKEPGSYLPESVFSLGASGHLVEGPCAECGALTHFLAECPFAFQKRFGVPQPGFNPSSEGTCAEALRRNDYYAPGGGPADYVLKAWAKHEWAPEDKTFEEQLKESKPRAHFWPGWKAVFASL